ncbi:TOBE domain-containing protein [Thioclava sp. GXIMD4216]|uniref:TOBE domain-containing protein n=1 Tax=Thioclava sp. GXIMD4216 TaxID=3131929 RepID=UPI0030D46790
MPARLSVRANAISLSGPETGRAAPPQTMTGRVRSAAYLGDHVEYEIESELGQLFAIDHANATPYAVGSHLALSFRATGLALLP